MRRPQFTLRALLMLMLAVACFFGGVQYERQRRRRALNNFRLEVDRTPSTATIVAPD